MHRAFRRFAALLVLAVPVTIIGRAGATWGTSPPAPTPPPREIVQSAVLDELPRDDRSESAVVLVVLDGVRWQEVFGGADRALAAERGMNPTAWAGPKALLPNVSRLLETRAVALGAPGHGEIVATDAQLISMPGYLEIFAGHPDPACDHNDCVRPPAHTVVDDVVASGGASEVAVVSSWPNIARASTADPTKITVTAGRHLVSHDALLRADAATDALLDRGARSAAFPGEGDYRPDSITARVALRVLVTQRPRFLFVGLGDADEYGHRNDYRGYLEAIHASDAFLGELFATLDGMGARGRHTTVLVTTDHGRAYGFKDHGARYPESARVWLLAGGGDVTGHGFVTAARRRTLSDVAPTVRGFLGIHGEGTPLRELVPSRSGRAGS